jgi:hypothetical protein
MEKTAQQKRFENALATHMPQRTPCLLLDDAGDYISIGTGEIWDGFALGEASALERALPEKFPTELIAKLRADPLTANGNDDEMHERIGWLVCAWPLIRALA